MRMNIDKNLLGEVLNKEVDSFMFVAEFKDRKNFLSITFEDGSTAAESIFEIENLFRDAIVDKGFGITSGRNKEKAFATISELGQKFIIVEDKSETVAVFNAINEFLNPED